MRCISVEPLPQPIDVWNKPDPIRTVVVTELITPLTPTLARMVDEGEWIRTGNGVCSMCQKKYSKHPSLEQNDWLNVLCDGTLVKL